MPTIHPPPSKPSFSRFRCSTRLWGRCRRKSKACMPSIIAPQTRRRICSAASNSEPRRIGNWPKGGMSAPLTVSTIPKETGTPTPRHARRHLTPPNGVRPRKQQLRSLKRRNCRSRQTRRNAPSWARKFNKDNDHGHQGQRSTDCLTYHSIADVRVSWESQIVQIAVCAAEQSFAGQMASGQGLDLRSLKANYSVLHRHR